MTTNIITYTLFNSIQLHLNLLCFGLDSADCYNKERVSIQYAAIASPASAPLLVQYCPNNVLNLSLVQTRNDYLYDF